MIKPNVAQSCQMSQKRAIYGLRQKPINKAKNGNPFKQRIPFFTAGGGTRTHTPSRTTDFESVSSANSDTPAHYFADLFSANQHINYIRKIGFCKHFSSLNS